MNIRENKKMSMFRKQEIVSGWLFVAPLLTGFLLFTAFPFIYAIYISFCSYDLFSPPVFEGVKNFAEIFRDEMFGYALRNVLVYSVGVPIGAGIALVLSSFIKSIHTGSLFFRMVFYIPCLCGTVAITFIWQWMYAPYYGILYKALQTLGIKPFEFLDSAHFMGSMMFMGIWSGLGVSILLFYSTLHGIPSSLYEAASIDGASAVSKFVHITLPGISPVSFYIVITGLVGSMQAFTQFQVMRGDAVSYASITPVWWIYRFTGKYGYRYGYASALGVVLGVMILAISAVQFLVSKYWVKYEE